MQRHGLRHFTAYFITAILYISIVILYLYSQNHRFISSDEPKAPVMNMSLSAFVPEALAPPKKVIEKVQEVIPEPTQEIEVIKKIEPIPVVEKKIVEKPVPKPVKKPIAKKIVKKNIKKAKVKKKTVKGKKRQRQHASSQQSRSSKAEKNKFLSALRQKIDKHKFYPRIAKKRRMEGTIKVKFTILKSGKVSNILLTGPKVFHNSARNAVKSAFPINVKKSPIPLPERINITLRYQVR